MYEKKHTPHRSKSIIKLYESNGRAYYKIIYFIKSKLISKNIMVLDLSKDFGFSHYVFIFTNFSYMALFVAL